MHVGLTHFGPEIAQGAVDTIAAAAIHLMPRDADLSGLTIGAYDAPRLRDGLPTIPPACDPDHDCPLGNDAVHARLATEPFRIAAYAGKHSRVVRPDGLTPEQVEFILAHGLLSMGPRGGKLITGYCNIREPVMGGIHESSTFFQFSVAVSGISINGEPAPWREYQLATAVGEAIVAELIETGKIPHAKPRPVPVRIAA